MIDQLKERLGVVRLTLPHWGFLLAFGFAQGVRLALPRVPPEKVPPFLQAFLQGTPWYFWALGWLLLLWLGAVEYSLFRKRKLDNTSFNFFKAYLDFLIQQGNKLYEKADGKDFYSRLNDWQHMVVEGIAIGMGPGESERIFHKMESEHPLSRAYQEARAALSNEPLCRVLKGNLEELEALRRRLSGTQLQVGEGAPGAAEYLGAERLKLPPKGK